MTHWRHILHCLFLLVLAAGPAGAENAGDSRTLVASASDSVRDDASWFNSESHLKLSRIYDPERIADGGDDTMTEPAGRSCEANAGTELESAPIDDAGLGSVSGGAILFVSPDVVNQRVFAIKLWDEGKLRRCAPYEQGNGKISSIFQFNGGR